MRGRKLRPVRAGGGSKKKVPSDVSPSTSLPPLVEGHLRCFLRVTISRVLWMNYKPPCSAFIRLCWWGESSNGTHFSPRDGSQLTQKTIKTTARFPIHCGPKQFTSYLTNMGSLVLDVLTKPDHLPIARAQVVGISRLSLSHPISGFYTLVSPTCKKLGELQVSLNLEPLTEAYDSSSSAPTTDINPEGLWVNTPAVPPQLISLSAGSKKESTGSSDGNTPRGKDHLYFQNGQKDKQETLENHSQSAVNPASQNSHGQTTNDVLSVILERGNKLTNAMVVSALKCDMDSASALKDTPLPLPKDNIQPPYKLFPSPSGMFLQNILEVGSAPRQSDVAGLDYLADIDKQTVDLLLGSSVTSPLSLWDEQHSPPESLSGHSSVCEDSELNDPQYDQTLLENLFYKTPISDTRPDDTGNEGQRTPFSSKNQQLKQSRYKIGDGPHSDHGPSTDAGGIHPFLNSEQLALLRLIRLVRVTIDSLTIPTGSSAATPRNTSNKGKPPQPLITKKCTYFVEYVLPMTTSSRRDRSKAEDGEVTRAVSSKVTGGSLFAVMFHQSSVFPVYFSLASSQHWCETDLIFKIYSRKSDQKKAVAIGKAVHPLCSLLQSRQLSQSLVLPVQSLEGNGETQEIGRLKVTLELGTDSKSFSSEKSKNKLTWRDASPSRLAPSPQRETGSRSQHADADREELPTHPPEESRLDVWTLQEIPKDPSPHPGLHTSLKPRQPVEEDPKVLLHALLMVPDGKNFSCEPLQAPNMYLNCKMFCCDEMARSVVSWGQANPTFNFVQVTPVALTTKLLDRMKNNMMVIEVWQKTGGSRQDRLLGLVKLPLHQFYMSFRDPKIAHLLLQAQYPVLGVDCYMPVIDVFSGSCKGNLRVVLAMGHSEQIVSLQRSRDEEYDSLSHLVRPVHLLDHQPRSQTKVIAAHVEVMREHLFVIKVEKVTGLMPLQSTVWGEADCYVQYSFPCQEGAAAAAEMDQNLIESSVNLKPFRTTTTLCVPDPLFGHSETHVLLAPEGVPVQRLLLSCLSSQGLCSGGGVQFEVWCRYYYPNVRDELLARGMLPLSKLCAMVTMQRHHPNEAQKFSLTLIPRTDCPTGHQPQPSGLLDVCVRYKHRPVRPEGQAGRGVASRVVTLVVQVHRASGLKAAARVISEQDERFSYFAGMGLNPFVTVQLSFLPESKRRCTRTAARTFCPEFNHHMEVSCDLLLQRSSGESCSLAEQLEQASAVFTVWNRDNRKALNLSKSKDVMLGTVKIPLVDLIYKRTGISGWFGVFVTQETSSSQHQHIMVGGLEISISFAHHADRERVIKAAQGLGWEMGQRDNVVQMEDEESWEESVTKLSLTFLMPRAWIPVHCLLLPGHSDLQRSTYCYYRYKFYDQEAFCSQMKHPCVKDGGEKGQATMSFEGSQTVVLRSTQPLMWYLQEERLEVQVWVTFNKNKARRPSDTDRLVGSAFIDLSSLTKEAKQKLTLSGVYPLFRRSAADLQGAALRMHITLTAGSECREVSADTQVDSDSQEELVSEEVEAEDRAPSPIPPIKSCAQSKQQNKSSSETPDITSVQHTETNAEESFPVTISVDRAMHLNLKGCPLAERNEGMPCCCVSYIAAESAEPVSTVVVANTDSPVWDHQHECRLSKQLLVDPQQSLVFKVWHKGELERVIGFASVDLSPLLSGFPSVCGWYNITDFSGQCHGQLKVSITPLKGVQDLRNQRKTVNEETARSSSVSPFSYQTTATYSSFPAHISRYPEQKISSPDHTDGLFSERSGESVRHFEHMDKVRLYHQSLQEQTACHSDDINPSSSLLFSALRKKLGELDNIQKYFTRKLSTPMFPSMPRRDHHTRQEILRDSESDTCQLFLKSNQLVEVNNIISGLQRHHLETIPSNTQSSFTHSPVGDNLPQTVAENISSSHRVSDYPSEVVSPLPSPLSESEPEEGEDRQIYKVYISEEQNNESSQEGVDGEEMGHRLDEGADDHDDDEEKDEDYEEVVVKPRPLNEVTFLTDRTSPWTSVLSDSDLTSLQSLEALEGSDLNEDVAEKRKTLETRDSGEKHKYNSREESQLHHSLNQSDASDTETDDERTLQTSDERQTEEPNERSGDTGSASTIQHAAETHNASGSLRNQGAHLQPSVPMGVPNFFLPAHQLEESVRMIRLAPSFSQMSSSDPGWSAAGQSVHPRRGPRQRPDMSPSSMKRETERIAKIFAAHCNEAH